MKNVLWFIKTKFVRYSLLLIICVSILAYIIPLIGKQHELNKIQTQIKIVEEKIEYNKQQRLSCSTNMELWNKDNKVNNKIVEELKTQYNNMVGFTEAWQPETSK